MEENNLNQQDAVDFVVRELGKHRQKNDIIQKLGETNEMNWSDADKFVRRVEAENSGAIARKQSPVITVMGVGTIILWLALVLWVVIETLQGYIIFFLSFPVPYLGNIFYFLTGTAMIMGGLRGIWDTVRSLWNN